MFTHILVPLDGSVASQRALPAALALAAACDASLTLLRVVSSPNDSDIEEYPLPYDASLEAERLAAVGTEMDVFAERLRSPGRRLEARVALGDPAEEIVRFAERAGADVIALASHGAGGAIHWAFGSVARRVLAAAPIPILLVRADTPIADVPQPADLGPIFVPLDASLLGETAVPLARTLARVLGAGVTLARIIPSPAAVVASPFSLLVAPEYYDRLIHDLRAAAHAHLERTARHFAADGIATDIVVREGNAAEELLRLLRERQHGLVIMATHGRTGMPRWIMGSVAERIATASHTPVLLVRPLETPERDAPENKKLALD